jgi:hypothetical protein
VFTPPYQIEESIKLRNDEICQKNKDRMKCDQMFGKKFCPIFGEKNSQNSCQASKYSSTLNIKIQNTYVQALLKLKISYNKPCFKTADLC